MIPRLALVTLLFAAGCGSGQVAVRTAMAEPTVVPAATEVPTPAPSPTRRLYPPWSPMPYTPAPIPHFDTPEAMMRYLADAWNRGDLGAVNRVTDPSAREQLWNMHREATDLRLKRCTYDAGTKDYQCEFTHEYPIGYTGDTSQVGEAFFRAGPARRTGWYMTYYEHCG